ncbi:hypothetical protein [Moorena sp. SIOASIH]|uniref:hypothetical protein n=1 Tax=Moorena sp. SIOASIH TaxID=2607817 RepID=UPI0025F2372C|nr:hypothetical protein [Moorena sp. SIOASIH]
MVDKVILFIIIPIKLFLPTIKTQKILLPTPYSLLPTPYSLLPKTQDKITSYT